MKKIIVLVFTSCLVFSACKKDKNPAAPTEEPLTPLAPEVITTLRIYIWDSLTNTAIAGSPFSFRDPDGEGGQPGAFLNNGADSLIILNNHTTYKTKVIILDETANPPDSISNEISGDESYEHMFFYNGDPSNNTSNNGNSIVNPGYPNYTVKLNGSGILVRYMDSDNGGAHGNPVRNIGLTTFTRTNASTNGSRYPFTLTLRHQPASKNGTYGPGETDIEVAFKIKVN